MKRRARRNSRRKSVNLRRRNFYRAKFVGGAHASALSLSLSLSRFDVQSFEKLQNRKEYFARVLLAQSAAGTHNKGELIAENV